MVERDDKFEEKYYLFKVEDMEAMLKSIPQNFRNGTLKEMFEIIGMAYDEYRKNTLGKDPQKYIAFNEDEPYAQFLYDFIVGNKDWKQFLPEEWDKLELQLRSARNARDEQYFRANKLEAELSYLNQVINEKTKAITQYDKVVRTKGSNINALEAALNSRVEQCKKMGTEINKLLTDNEVLREKLSTERRFNCDLNELNKKLQTEVKPIVPTCGPITRDGCTEITRLAGELELRERIITKQNNAIQRFEEQLKEKQCEVTQLRNDLQLYFNKCEELTLRNDTLESINRHNNPQHSMVIDLPKGKPFEVSVTVKHDGIKLPEGAIKKVVTPVTTGPATSSGPVDIPLKTIMTPTPYTTAVEQIQKTCQCKPSPTVDPSSIENCGGSWDK